MKKVIIVLFFLVLGSMVYSATTKIAVGLTVSSDSYKVVWGVVDRIYDHGDRITIFFKGGNYIIGTTKGAKVEIIDTELAIPKEGVECGEYLIKDDNSEIKPNPEVSP